MNPSYGEMYSIQLCVIKFVSDLPQVGGVLRILWFSPPLKHHNHNHKLTQFYIEQKVTTYFSKADRVNINEKP
jgi:hypothetical protein